MVYIEHEKYLTPPGLNFSFHGTGLLKVELLVQRFRYQAPKRGRLDPGWILGHLYGGSHCVPSKRTVLRTSKARKSLKS